MFPHPGRTVRENALGDSESRRPGRSKNQLQERVLGAERTTDALAIVNRSSNRCRIVLRVETRGNHVETGVETFFPTLTLRLLLGERDPESDPRAQTV